MEHEIVSVRCTHGVMMTAYSILIEISEETSPIRKPVVKAGIILKLIFKNKA